MLFEAAIVRDCAIRYRGWKADLREEFDDLVLLGGGNMDFVRQYRPSTVKVQDYWLRCVDWFNSVVFKVG